MKLKMTKRYTKAHRLSDVIRLITVLAIDKYSFRNIENLEKAIRGKPLSASSWLEIANIHPEFFRPNGDNTSIALLLRSYLPTKNDDSREALSILETQNLIEVAISLHDKEIQRFQRNGHLFPLIVAIIALLGVIFTSIFNHYFSNDTNSKLDSINQSIKQIEIKLENNINNTKNNPI
ncbi:hypothetical protein OA88_06610 [Flavobacterium sp. JRM]|nr:hypothetical protein OA88_06610 [Flavobacterium sp. JRM]